MYDACVTQHEGGTVARPKRFTARVNVVMPATLYDEYARIASSLDTSIPQLVRDILDGALPQFRKLEEIALAAKQQDAGLTADLFMRYLGGIQGELAELRAEAEPVVEQVKAKQRRKSA